MTKEIWKFVPGYEGLYMVSNLGRVKSLPRNTTKGKIITLKKATGGYLRVHLSKDGISKSYSVHRLVAQAFIPNPDNLPCVNHINEDKTDNRVENLEWCTYEYNCNYGTRNSRISKKVNQYTLDGTLVRSWNSIKEAALSLNYIAADITTCCKGRIKQHYGFIWRYQD